MKRSNQKGFALGWVMIIMMILLIFIATAMKLSAGYHARTLLDHAKLQTHFTALSVAQLIATDFVREDGEWGEIAAVIMNELKKDGIYETGQLTLSDIQIEGMDSGMGACSVSAAYDLLTGELEITVWVEKDNQVESVRAFLVNEAEDDRTAAPEFPDRGGTDVSVWKLLQYRGGIGEDKTDWEEAD